MGTGPLGPQGQDRLLLRALDRAEGACPPSSDPRLAEAFSKSVEEAYRQAVAIDRKRLTGPPPAPAAPPTPEPAETPEARAERIWRITQAMARGAA